MFDPEYYFVVDTNTKPSALGCRLCAYISGVMDPLLLGIMEESQFLDFRYSCSLIIFTRSNQSQDQD